MYFISYPTVSYVTGVCAGGDKVWLYSNDKLQTTR